MCWGICSRAIRCCWWDGAKEGLSIGTRKWEKRSVSEPAGENVVRGPRQGFTETLRINTSMLRRIVKNPNLRFVSMKLGKQTKTDVVVAYIKEIARPELVDEVKKRLGGINTDSILDSGYIEAFIEDAPYSIFPTVAYSEKPGCHRRKASGGPCGDHIGREPVCADRAHADDGELSDRGRLLYPASIRYHLARHPTDFIFHHPPGSGHLCCLIDVSPGAHPYATSVYDDGRCLRCALSRAGGSADHAHNV